MKKFLTVLLTVVLALSFSVLSACNETENGCEHVWIENAEKNSKICSVCGAFDGIEVTEQGWDGSLAEQAFENVTINYVFIIEQAYGDDLQNDDIVGAKTINIVKIADDKVYIKTGMYDQNGEFSDVAEGVLVGGEATIQKNWFLAMFKALLEEYDNFVYDSEKGVYVNPEEITVTVSMGEGGHTVDKMTDGKVKFGQNGKLEYFECNHTESVYFDGELAVSVSGKIVWTWSDYGTTVIEEDAAN